MVYSVHFRTSYVCLLCKHHSRIPNSLIKLTRKKTRELVSQKIIPPWAKMSKSWYVSLEPFCTWNWGSGYSNSRVPWINERKKWHNFIVKNASCCSNVETEYWDKLIKSVLSPFSCLFAKVNNTVNSSIPYILSTYTSMWGPHMMSLVTSYLSTWGFTYMRATHDVTNYILPVYMSIWGPHMMSLITLSVWIFCCPNDLQNNTGNWSVHNTQNCLIIMQQYLKSALFKPLNNMNMYHLYICKLLNNMNKYYTNFWKHEYVSALYKIWITWISTVRFTRELTECQSKHNDGHFCPQQEKPQDQPQHL